MFDKEKIYNIIFHSQWTTRLSFELVCMHAKEHNGDQIHEKSCLV